MSEELTPRMLDYLREAAAGHSERETALRLWVSLNTVKNQRKAVMRRLGARNTAHAVAIAYERGLLP